MARTRTRTATPVPEPVVEETTDESSAPSKRGPSELTMAFVAWLKEAYDVDADPEVVYLAQTTRREFRDSDIYEKYMDAEDQRKEAADAAKAEKLAAREAAKQAEDDEPEATEEAPAPRGRRRAAKATAPAATDEPATEAPAAPARRTRRAAAAAPAAEATTEATAPAKPTRSRGKAPF